MFKPLTAQFGVFHLFQSRVLEVKEFLDTNTALNNTPGEPWEDLSLPCLPFSRENLGILRLESRPGSHLMHREVTQRGSSSSGRDERQKPPGSAELMWKINSARN